MNFTLFKKFASLVVLSAVMALFGTPGKAQTNSITIGGTGVNGKAVLWLVPNGGQGLLLPSISSSTRTGMGLGDPDKGMIVYDNTESKLYLWNGSGWIDVLGSGATTTITLTGDVSGLSSATTVSALQGHSVSNTVPLDQQILKWNDTKKQWEPGTLTSATSVKAGTGINVTPDNTVSIPTGGITTTMILDGTIANVDLANVSVDDAKISSVAPGKISAAGAVTGNVLKWDGTKWAPSTDNGTALTTAANSGILLNAGDISVDAGTTANKIVKLDAAGKLPAVDGSQLTNLPSGSGSVTSITTGTGLTGGTITSSGTIALAPTTVNAGDYGDATHIPQLTIDAQGRVTSATSFTISAGGSGTITSITAGSGLAGGTITSAGTVSLIPGVTIGQILKWDGTQWSLAPDAVGTGSVPTLSPGQLLVGDGTSDSPGGVAGDLTMTNGGGNALFTIGANAVTTTKINDGAITTSKVVDGAVTPVKLAPGTAGQVLQTIGTTPTWTTLAGSGSVTSITAGTGLSGGTITTAGTISLPNTGVAAASYGDATHIPQITVDAQGRITAALGVLATAGGGTVTSVSAGSGLTGGPITTTGSLSLANTAVTAGPYGDGTHVAQLVIDAQGRITNAVSVPVTAGLTNPMTATGDLIVGGAAGAPTRLPLGTNGQVLSSNGTTTAWTNLSGGGTITGVTTAPGSGLSGGGLTGTLPLRLVDGAAAGQILKYDGTQWSLASDDVGTGSVPIILPNNILIGDGTTNSQAAVNGDLTMVTGGGNATFTIGAGKVTTTQIAANTITNANISAAAAVAVSKIAAGTAGQVLQTIGTVPTWTTLATGATDLNGLSDAIVSAPSAGQILINDGAGQFQNRSLSGAITMNTTGVTTLANTAVTPSTYGDGTHVGQVTIDATGRITTATSVLITGVAPTGAAGGDLAGTFPNPTVAPSAITSAKIVDGTIVNVDIAAGAAIDGLKVTPAFGAQNISTTGSLATGATTTINTVGYTWPAAQGAASTVLTNSGTGTLTWTPAAGGLSPALTSGNIFVGNAGNTATGVALSGDASIVSSGAITLANNATTRGHLGLGSLSTLSTVTTTEITDGTIANVDIANVDAAKITTGTLAVARGGSGITAVVPGAVAYGGAANFAFTAAGTGGQLLQSNGAAAPTWVNAPGPSGAAAGDLTGTYPNPTIATTAGADIITAVNAAATSINGVRVNPDFGAQNVATTGTVRALQFTNLVTVANDALVTVHNSATTGNSGGVFGATDSPAGYGVWGLNSAAGGYGIHGTSTSPGFAGYFDGDVKSTGTTTTAVLNVNGSATTLVNITGAVPDQAALVNIANSDESHFMLLFPGRTSDPNPFIQVKLGDPFRIANDASGFTELFRVDGSGDVGIGSSTPSERLDVVGNVRFSGALMPNNDPGTAGKVLTSAGAGLPPTWSALGGGGDMLKANNLSDLTNITTARTNLGLGAAAQLSTGSVTAGGVAYGAAANFAFTPAGTTGQVLQSNGTAAPTWAALSIPNLTINTGTQSISEGLGTSLTGNFNTLIGHQAGSANTASGNTIVGRGAGTATTSGGNNTFMGSSAGSVNTTGAGNVFIGPSAGGTNTTGIGNVAIGSTADVSTGALTNAIAIGNGAVVGASNSMALGGTGANAVKVGIGTATPTTAKLVIAGTAGQEGLDLSTTDQYANLRVIHNSNSTTDKDMYIGIGSGGTSTLHLYSNDVESMTVKGGNIGIDTSTITSRLTVNGNIGIGSNQRIGFSESSTFLNDGKTIGNNSLGWYTDSWSGAGNTAWMSGIAGVKIFTGSAQRVSINSIGNMGVGRNATANNFEVAGNASKLTAGGWIANSDRRIKTNIQDITNSLELLKKLRPVTFSYSKEWLKRNPQLKDQVYYNFIAQEFQEVFPEAVKGSGEYLEGDKKEILQIDTYNAQIVSIKAIQEQQKIIETQQSEINELKKELGEIKSYLNMETKAPKKKKSKGKLKG